MNDSYSALADMYRALAAERTRSMLTEARIDRLAREGRGSSPSRLIVRSRSYVVDGAHRARLLGHSSVQWLRKGQLAGYPSTCKTC